MTGGSYMGSGKEMRLRGIFPTCFYSVALAVLYGERACAVVERVIVK